MIEKSILTGSIAKGFLIDPLTTNNTLYRDSSILIEKNIYLDLYILHDETCDYYFFMLRLVVIIVCFLSYNVGLPKLRVLKNFEMILRLYAFLE